MKEIKRLLLAILCLGSMFTAIAQERQVSGTVVSEDDNSPLPGVTVTNTKTNKRTVTNAAGYYAIMASTGDVLSFSSIGFGSTTQTVGTGALISVRLTPSEKVEQVVTVYGTRKSKRELGYSAQEVKGEEVAQTRRENFLNSLAGRVAGINITPTSGVPGASTSVVLRGAVSIGGNNQPLIVVDGIPFDNQTMNQENLASGTLGSTALGNRNSDYTNRAGDINPEDIETITVLKGPEATALYGSDGASGAIIITTRKGKAGKASVSYNNSFRWEKVYRFPEVQNVYSRGLNGVANQNATVDPYAAGALLAYFGPKYADSTVFYDNFNNFFGTGHTQNHNMNVEGGADMLTYRFSAGYINQTGIVPNTKYQRMNFRLSSSLKLNPKVSITTSLGYTNSTNNKAPKGAGSYFLNLLNFPGDVDVRQYLNPDGSRKILRGNATITTEFDNPFWDVNKNSAADKVDRFNGNFTFNYDPFKWLNLNLITGVDLYNQDGDLTVHPQSRSGFASGGFYSVYQQLTRNWSNVLKGTLKKNFGDFNNTLTVGFANDDLQTRIDAERGEQFYEADFRSLNNTAPSTRDAKTTVNNSRKVRFFGNYSLGYKNLAFLSFAGSREGISTLISREVEKDPFYNFGSASFSLILSDIGPMKNISWLNYAKARISYGSTGKGPNSTYIIDYTLQSQLTTGGGFSYGFTGNNFGLRPEYTKNFEYGGELKLFNNKLSLDVTQYSLRSRDQIIAARASYGTGYVIKWFNGGLVENKGLEIIAKISPITNKNFSWDLTANFDRNRGRILEMPADLPTYYDSDTWVLGNLRSQVYAGVANGNLSGYNVAKNTAGQVLISQTSGLPFRGSDFEVVGDRQPDFKVGLINSFTYKAFNLSFNLDFRKGGDVFNGNEYILFLTGRSMRTLDRDKSVIITGVLNDGLQNTKNPTINTVAVNPYFRSEYYGTGAVLEADFIETVNWMRLRDATLSYTLPSSLLKKQKVFKSASVFVTGTDLFMITNYTGADPSVNANTAFSRGYGGAGIDYGTLATPRGILFGINVKF
jgi:ferric enterobactin receptor